MTEPPTVVLVHGAWHGAWCWQPVVERLRARDVPVVALDLPGHGDDPRPLTDLHGHGDAVRVALDAIDGPVLLVGHSYGGAAITDAGIHPAVRALAFISSFPVDDGESMMVNDVPGGEENALRAAMEIVDDLIVVDPVGAADAFFHDCAPADATAAVARLCAERLDGFGQSPRAVAWRERPGAYAVCTEDRAVSAALQRNFARRCTETVEWPTSHSPFLSQPDVVADWLHAQASAVAP